MKTEWWDAPLTLWDLAMSNLPLQMIFCHHFCCYPLQQSILGHLRQISSSFCNHNYLVFVTFYIFYNVENITFIANMKTDTEEISKVINTFQNMTKK